MAQLTTQQAFDQAVQRHRAGRLHEAEQLYREVLLRQSEHADAMHNLAVIAHQTGRNDFAVELIHKAIALRPNFAEAYCNLGDALNGKGQLDEALAATRQAIALRPNFAEAYSNLGRLLKDNGQLDEAVAACRQAIALIPSFPEAHINLGNALKEKGQPGPSIAAFRQAIALRPNHAEAHYNLGVVLNETGQTDEAVSAYRQAIALKPNYTEAHYNLGVALKETGQFDDAVAAYQQAIALRPNYADAYNNLANTLGDKGHVDEAIAAYQRAIAIDPDNAGIDSNLLFAIHFHPAYNAQSLAKEHSRWNRRHAEPLRKLIRPHSNDPRPERRLRIGYVSPDFSEHTLGRFLLPLLAHHDKKQVEVFAFSLHRPDATMQRVRSCSDGWRDISEISDAQAVDLIREDQIDILVDLTMHTAENRLLIFARKPAPVQVTYLAYCSTTGMDTIDYRLSDPYLDPPGEETFYSEQTMRLPGTYWCYQSIADSPEVNTLPALNQSVVTFGCLNKFSKISEPTLKVWIELLQATPNSRLVLSTHEGTHRQRIKQLMQREGIEPERLQFKGKVRLLDYLRLYHEIDIALDTFPYAGGTTTCDALWMGVPVVSLVGKTAVGRGGLSILSNLGLPELVARSEQEYVRIAGELANDFPRLSELRSTLRRRMKQSPLMDAPKFARNVEAAYRQMWHTWCKTARAKS